MSVHDCESKRPYKGGPNVGKVWRTRDRLEDEDTGFQWRGNGSL